MKGGKILKILAIMDNLPGSHKGLAYEHGLSFYIEGSYNKLLFDFGQGENTLKNFKSLGLDPRDLDLGIISHSHYDHANGFMDFSSFFKGKTLITGRGFFNKKYGVEDEILSYLGLNFDHSFLNRNNTKHITFDDFYKIDDELYLIGNFENLRPNPNFLVEKDGKLELDLFSDEISLVIKRPEGISVLLGCSHPGVIPMLEKIGSKFNEKIINVFGGTHLIGDTKNQIMEVLNSLKSLGVKNIYFSHCSGSRALDIFAQDKDINARPLKTGAEVRL